MIPLLNIHRVDFHPSPLLLMLLDIFIVSFETCSHSAAQAGLKVKLPVILLPRSLHC